MKSFEGSIVLRNRTSGIIALAAIPIAVAAVVATIFVRNETPAMVATYAIIPSLVALAYHLGWTRAKHVPARIDVSPGSLAIGGETRRVARARIVPQPAGRNVMVEIARRFDPYPARVAVPTLDEARGLVRALGLDPREGATRFRGPTSEYLALALFFVGSIAACVAMVPLGALLGSFGFVLGLAFGAGVAIALQRAAIPTITIGRDGILIERFFRKRFLPYASIVALEREGRENWRGQAMVSRGFWVRLDSGEKVLVDTRRERMRDYMFQGDHLFDAAVEAHTLARTEQPRAADVLARGGRKTKEWLAQLDGARDVRYRVAAISDEELALVLANPNADKTARAGAAICLARAGEEARTQVRVAAEDIAEPDVRKAALAALEDDEEALAAALEALE